MASVQPRNGRWVARWREPDGTSRQRTVPTRAEAQQLLATVSADIHRGAYVASSLASTPVSDVARRWLDSKHNLAPASRERLRQILDRHVLPAVGGRAVGSVRHSDVEALVARMTADGLAPATVRKAVHTVGAVFTRARRDGLCTVNPVEGVELPRQARREMRWLTPAEVERVAAAAGAHRVVVRFLAYTGVRWGEMASLTVGDVDRARRRVRVYASKTSTQRWVPVIPSLWADVEPLLDRDPGASLFGGLPRMDHGNFTARVWKPAKRAAGVDPAVRIHDLRHSCATWLIDAGENVVKVADWLGHANPTVTLAVYAHLMDHDLASSAAALERMTAA